MNRHPPSFHHHLTVDHRRWVGALTLAILLSTDAIASRSGHRNPPSPEHGITEQTAALTKNPNNASAYLRRAEFHLALAGLEHDDPHLRAAADDLAAATRLSPSEPDTHGKYADVATRLGEYQLAVVEYTAAIGLAPRHASLYAGRGLAYLALRKDRRAKVDLSYAVRLSPGLRAQLEAEEARIRAGRQEIITQTMVRHEAAIDAREDVSPDLSCLHHMPLHMMSQCRHGRRADLVP